MGHRKKNIAPRLKQAAQLSGNTKIEVLALPVESEDGSSSSSPLSSAAVKGECERALTALRRGNHTKALRLMKDACSRHENSVHAALIHRVQSTARKAAELSPNSIEFAHFYANLLYESANYGKEYEEVIQECERALAIENPVDPAKESLQEESQQKIPTAEARILHVQSELRALIQKSNIASISTWMKNLGSGEEKFRLIPVRRVTEDPMEVRLVQARRPNEIRKAAKTPEERRKEIEREGERIGLELTSGDGQRGGADRRRKNGSTSERRDWVRSFWNSMSVDSKKDLLRIRVSDLKAYFGLLKDGLASEVLSEALAFAEVNKTWKFWVCCRCSEKFVDSESHMQHFVQEHMGKLIPKMQNVLPQSVDKEWIEMLLNCSWYPLDISASLKMIGNGSKFGDLEFSDDFYSGRNDGEEIDGCLKDVNDSPLEKEKFRDSYNCGSAEGNDCDTIHSIECKDCDGNQGSIACHLVDCGPIADDAESAKLLEKIRATFKLLFKHNYLATDHLNKVIQFTMDELQSMFSGSQLLNYGVDQNPKYSETSAPMDDVNGSTQVLEVKEKIILSEDASCLLLDEHLLADAAIGDASQGNANSNGNRVIQDADALLSWIFFYPSRGDQLALWTRIKEEKAQQGLEILQILEKEFYHLQSLCERKCKKRESSSEFVHRSYEPVLRKRKEELENESDVMFLSARFELDIISNVLKEVEELKVNQLGYVDTYDVVTSQLYDLESGEDDDWEQLSVELSKMDARIMRNVIGMQQLEVKLEPVSAHDYQTILLPLVKSYLRVHLEDLAEKDATEKSDAAREAFLAELARDSKKGIRGGNDNSRNSQEKSKDKKKNKEFRKSQDSKASGGNELHILNNETAEQVSLAVVSDGDHLGSEVVSLDSNDLKQQEEELRRKIELEAEEKKLEETLEYQRRIENEAKQKQLAKQNKKSNQAYAKNAAHSLHGAYLETGDLDIKEHLAPKDRVANDWDSIPMSNANGSVVPITDNKIKQGLSNGTVSEDGSSERWTGRKVRRYKSSNRFLDGKSQVVSSEKESIQVGSSRVHVEEQVRYVNGVPTDSVAPISGEGDATTLRPLQAQEDDEERFQADLKKAVRQSLDTYHAQRAPLQVNNQGVSPNDVTNEGLNEIEVFGTGLQNEVGEYNCFLNVIIQSLWHLRRFCDEFFRRSTSEHVHVGDPCVVCALYEIFIALNTASTDARREPVSPTSLRIALSNLYPDSNFFQVAQMNDASEVLAVIFDCLHRSFTSGSSVCDADSVDSNCAGFWDCASNACIVHSLFGMDVFERMNCYNCGLESRHLKYTTFFHNINASALRTMKAIFAESSFDELLNLVEMNHQLACDPEAG
ncbi:hypothetical protein F3Y22_tig00111721pilonHSYRG00032 [Hibiscus syriacus]|uniref:USP domain-containing protein n=1 Tax=Hibiscus syriacus TaxID=106335 RepID=A0A6A2XGT4_HIBSY|nr:hypothetical protein F3Y22_tig00111721pilonHSYRG00032 [Hibiscus syriacus]